MVWNTVKHVNTLPDARQASIAAIYITPDGGKWVIMFGGWVDFDWMMKGDNAKKPRVPFSEEELMNPRQASTDC